MTRYARLMNCRIGHLAANTEVYLCQQDAGLHPDDTVFFFGWPNHCNEQLAAMWARTLPMVAAPPENAYIVDLQGNGDADNHALLRRSDPHLSFTAEEEERGARLMVGLGITHPFVALHVRDHAYLKCGYHDYRDADVADYRLAAEWLADQGYTVVRMGAVVAAPLVSGHPRVIDYATTGRSDFMDIYLSAKCDWMISTGSGIDAVAAIFRRPLLICDLVPFTGATLTWGKQDMAYGKHIFRNGVEIHDAPVLYETQQYAQAGLTIQNMTPDEILTAVQTMAGSLA